MKLEELIGKKIADIRMQIKDYNSNGELESADSVVLLESGEIFEIPQKNASRIKLLPKINKQQKSIFGLDNFLKKIFAPSVQNEKVVKRNIKYIKGEKIIAIYQYETQDDETDWNELEDKMIIEVESGYLISEIEMASRGTGSAGVWIFTSKEDLKEKFGADFVKKY